MGFFKKSPKEEDDSNQDLNFVKQNVASKNIPSEKPSGLPKLTDILENKPAANKSTEQKPVRKENGNIPASSGDGITNLKAALAFNNTQTNVNNTQPKVNAAVPSSQKPKTSFEAGPKTSSMSESPLKGIRTDIESQKKLIQEQNQKLEDQNKKLEEQIKLIEEQNQELEKQNQKIDELESSFKNLETSGPDTTGSEIFDKLKEENEEKFKEILDRIDQIEQVRTEEGDGALSQEEQALVKAGKYIEKQMSDVKKIYDVLDDKINEMRNFMTDVDDKERRFTELEEHLTRIQRKTESIIESDLLSKSNEAINNLEENKQKILEEVDVTIKSIEERVQEYRSDIDSIIKRAEDSVDGNIDRMKDMEREVRKAIDEKIEYDIENMNRVNEVVSIMKEAVQKILGEPAVIADTPENPTK